MKKNSLSALILVVCFGHADATVEDIKLRPVPWVTHEAVLFLEKFMEEHPDARVLEFGSGASTVWFAKRTKNLTSVEHSPEWHSKMTNILATTVECSPVNLMLLERPYFTICDTFFDNHFDLILVDGRNRSGCMRDSMRILKPGGVLMLDNAERPYYQKAIRLLQGWKGVSTNQPGPDSCGFTYPNWQTNWYFKP